MNICFASLSFSPSIFLYFSLYPTPTHTLSFLLPFCPTLSPGVSHSIVSVAVLLVHPSCCSLTLLSSSCLSQYLSKCFSFGLSVNLLLFLLFRLCGLPYRVCILTQSQPHTSSIMTYLENDNAIFSHKMPLTDSLKVKQNGTKIVSYDCARETGS